MLYKNKWFTLVELIVVITILAILGTIAFISLQWHSRNARDSVRINDMASIKKWLWILLVRWGIVPVPEDKVDITSSGELVWYQWDAGENVLSSIGMIARGWKDPVDDTYYGYMTNDNLSSYQLLWYLESWGEITLNIFNDTHAVDYAAKFKKIEWDSLGILTESVTEIPLHRVESVVSSWGLDIQNTADSYTANFDDSVSVSGTGTQLQIISNMLSVWWIVSDDCQSLLDANRTLKNKDGIYVVGSEDPHKVYCDMTTTWVERISDSLLNEWNFTSGSGISTEFESNPTNTIVSIASPVTSWYAIHQTDSATAEYEVHLPDITKCKKWDEIVLRTWVADAGGSIFHHRGFYDGGNFYSSGWSLPNPTILKTEEVSWKTWELQEVRVYVSQAPTDFDWYIWYNAEDPKDLYFTGVRIACE
jgi:prepilin-type N-terminal cleavage/methylation domain-containing protein